MEKNRNNAEVIHVKPDSVKIAVTDLNSFKEAEENLQVGSYLQILDDDETKTLIAIIDSFSIDLVTDDEETEFDRRYIIEASPLGIIDENNKFTRGGDTLSIPPKDVKPAPLDDIKSIFQSTVSEEVQFKFGRLANNPSVEVPVDGNSFFNKHIAIVGASGSGKSHTVAKIFQNAIKQKKEGFSGLNNSHIVLFDIHSEYESAFHNPNIIDVSKLVLPYWMMNDEELEELFLESGDRNNYNQASVLRNTITNNKIKYAATDGLTGDVFFDSPIRFNISEIANYLLNISKETINAKNKNRYMVEDTTYSLEGNGGTTADTGLLLSETERNTKYFKDVLSFHPTKGSNISKGVYADGTLDKFISRIQSKISDKRLDFLFGEKSFKITFEEVIRQLTSYIENKNSNITIIDLSGVPFEVLSITVSLISRILFDVGYYKKQALKENNTPLMLVYEEAHQYAPKSNLAKYRSSITAIERIAKEGRKYGVTLCIVSQRPSEISETIFSQCNNFVAMRLTNPEDQNYVKRLIPDSLEGVTESLPALSTGEALLIGDAIAMPTVIQVDECSTEMAPSSNDINYIEEWMEPWKDIEFKKIIDEWI